MFIKPQEYIYNDLDPNHSEMFAFPKYFDESYL